MGLFDFFKRNKGGDDDGKPVDRKFAGIAKTASDKRAQAYDRDEALRALIDIGTPAAAEALLKRFSLSIDPSITDQEEKQLAFDGIVRIGMGRMGIRVSEADLDPKQRSDAPLDNDEVAELREAVIAGVRTYCERAENLTWPIKVVRALLDDEAYAGELLKLLSAHDTEYTRNVEPKINLLHGLEEVQTSAVREAVEEYLDDVNETVRYHAVENLYIQDDPACVPKLVAMCEEEESVRIKNRVAEGLMKLEWAVPEELVERFQTAMKDAYEYRVTDSGAVERA